MMELDDFFFQKMITSLEIKPSINEVQMSRKLRYSQRLNRQTTFPEENKKKSSRSIGKVIDVITLDTKAAVYEREKNTLNEARSRKKSIDSSKFARYSDRKRFRIVDNRSLLTSIMTQLD
uniref:Uncharacterized protein n=1 Tax=Caenorhabditis tropicalis TaxID=1561998 RepID=A0A1I7U3T3_9PELO